MTGTTITFDGQQVVDAHACALDALADQAQALCHDAGGLDEWRTLLERVEILGMLGGIVPNARGETNLTFRDAHRLRETAREIVEMVDNYLNDTDHYGMALEWAESLRPARGRAQRVLHALAAQGIRAPEAVPS